MSQGGPRPIGEALSELVALRGWARATANDDLTETWNDVAGPEIAARTRVGAIKRGILHVSVDNSALLGELAGFLKDELLAGLLERRPELRLKDLRFRLRS